MRKRNDSAPSDAELEKLKAEGKKEEFFQRIIPVAGSLRKYIKRRLRLAYLMQQIRTEVLTSGDILDSALLFAYENYQRKPPGLSAEEWLYRIANELLNRYLRQRAASDARRRSLETLTQAELRDLEERMTTDADGEIMLEEDLGYPEYEREFVAPAYQDDPLARVQREEELALVLNALSRLPMLARNAFELSELEGFPKDAVARILDITPAEVEAIVNRVRAQLRQATQSNSSSRKSPPSKAS